MNILKQVPATFGDIEKLKKDYKQYGGLVFNDTKLFNPLGEMPKEYVDNPHLFYAFILSRTEYISFICSQFLNVNLLPFQSCILQEIWKRKFPMLVATRGAGKSFILAVYVILRQLLLPERKMVIAGASFRQSKLIAEYCQTIWRQAPLLRDAVSAINPQPYKGGNDAVHFNLGYSKAIFIPVGTGETIRGLRANDIVTDEFKSHNREIFENVISGFGAVSSAPHEKVENALEKEFNKTFGLPEPIEHTNFLSNQIIISGTAYYYFNHFAEYWEKWRSIINTKGDVKKLAEISGTEEEGFNWRDYSVIRLPYTVLPKGYMDSGNIARSKATLHKGLFDMEFEAVFSKDSEGFFKASLIESCVCNPSNEITKSEGEIVYHPLLNGDPDKKYYMGVDTASQVDNFAIVILEQHKDHRRIVYSWTTNTKAFQNAKKQGKIEETDFFRYCSRKIRDLMSRFNLECISIDSQGGGRTIYESLHDKDSLKPGEQMLWEIIDPNKKRDTDHEEGLHIIEMVNFRKQDYTSPANHGLRKDFEEKVCLFPEYSTALLATYGTMGNDYGEEMEDCIEDIESLKAELTQIVVTSTATGSERFDTPEVKLSGSEKTRSRKDRYSALIMANMKARTDYDLYNNYERQSLEAISDASNKRKASGFVGPKHIVSKLDDMYDGLYD